MEKAGEKSKQSESNATGKKIKQKNVNSVMVCNTRHVGKRFSRSDFCYQNWQWQGVVGSVQGYRVQSSQSARFDRPDRQLAFACP